MLAEYIGFLVRNLPALLFVVASFDGGATDNELCLTHRLAACRHDPGYRDTAVR